MGLNLQSIVVLALVTLSSIAHCHDLLGSAKESEHVEVNVPSSQERFGNERGVESSHLSDDSDHPVMVDDLDLDLDLWPFNKKNKTHEDTSCSNHKNCEECSSSSSFCHWCAHDDACHSKGSFHGCFEGVTCEPPKPKENSTCGSHTTCSECALSSSLCHWCAHDNACHAVGSVYGCLSGVDCYSNDRCQRDEPEEITGVFIQDVGMMPLVIIFSVGLMCCCCATLAYCTASSFKGAYDDIVIVAAGNPEGSIYGIGPRSTAAFPRQPTVVNVPASIQEHENEDGTEEGHEDDGMDNEDDDEECPQEEDEHDLSLDAALLENHMGLYMDVHDGYSMMTGMVSATPSAYATVQARGGSNAMQGIFNVCRACYFVTVVGIVGSVVASVRYFPKTPTYNVCNDNLAWKKVVDSMASFKAEATFEILVSVLNPNRFDVDVDMGRGTFKHNGVFVGTFDIPPTHAPAMTVMDVLILAHFTPGTWEALSLTSEYRKGTLAFDIDAKATFRFPQMFDYSMTGSFNDLHVKVNDPLLDDRHLCECPTWDDAKNKSIAIF